MYGAAGANKSRRELQPYEYGCSSDLNLGASRSSNHQLTSPLYRLYHNAYPSTPSWGLIPLLDRSVPCRTLRRSCRLAPRTNQHGPAPRHCRSLLQHPTAARTATTTRPDWSAWASMACCASNARRPPAPTPPRAAEEVLVHPMKRPGVDTVGAAERALREELGSLKPSVLRKQVKELGVAEEQVDAAEDSADPHAALMDLLVSAALPEKKDEGGSRPASDETARWELRAQLDTLKYSALRKRARELGVDEAEVDAAGDSDEPRNALINLLVASTSLSEGYGQRASNERPVAALRRELSSLTLKRLKQYARELGVCEKALEDAEDGDDVNSAVVSLCIEAKTKGQGLELARLRAVLGPLRLKALKIRAREAGVSAQALDEADDADDVKQAVTELIIFATQQATQRSEAVDKDNERSDATATECADKRGRPHFGAPTPVSGTAAESRTQDRRRHCMLSYSWTVQQNVINVRQRLVSKGIVCWMDIDGVTSKVVIVVVISVCRTFVHNFTYLLVVILRRDRLV
eukprot:SAG31_NODE_1886_length_6989_cov_6.914514_3_plen_521_part_00